MAEVGERIDDVVDRVIAAATGEANPVRSLSHLLEAIRKLTVIADQVCQAGSSNAAQLPKVSVVGAQPAKTTSGNGYLRLNTDFLTDSPRTIYKARRIRDAVFDDPTLFGEPAWDILLDALDAELAGKAISITSACMAASVPPTTALRWITLLEQRGFLTRYDDEGDRRRSFLKLTPLGREKMEAYFARLAKLPSRSES